MAVSFVDYLDVVRPDFFGVKSDVCYNMSVGVGKKIQNKFKLMGKKFTINSVANPLVRIIEIFLRSPEQNKTKENG